MPSTRLEIVKALKRALKDKVICLVIHVVKNV
jgi:hypothetical protein